MQVCELFDPIIGDWNAELVYSLFPCNIACMILKIKIHPTLQPDKLIWAHDKRGVYTVKSA